MMALGIGLKTRLPFLPDGPTTGFNPSSVLILGGSSALGAAVIQLLRLAVPDCLILATSSPKHHKHLVSVLGADGAFDRNSTSLITEVKSASGSQGVDAIIDAVGAGSSQRNIFEAFNPSGPKKYAQVWTGDEEIQVPSGVDSVMFRGHLEHATDVDGGRPRSVQGPLAPETGKTNRRITPQCDCPEPSAVCINCRLSGEQCTFDLPLGRRGPKVKRHKANNTVGSRPHHAPTTPTSQLPEADAASQLVCAPDSRTLSLDAWDAGLSALDPALSPDTVHTVRTSISDAPSARTISSLQRWHSLARELSLRSPSAHLERMINRCFDYFFEYLFPLIPLVHEPSLRDGLSFFVNQATGRSLQGSNSMPESILYRANSLKYPDLWPDHTFTLITAVCAEAAFLLPKDIFPEGEEIADIFLHASRNCLSSYLEADLEYPNANSVAIRYLHSNCMHAAGKPRFSWHIFGEATRLAQVMQLHDEKSLQGLSPLEAEFRRRAFWIAYIGDKSAAILNNRPITIHKFSFESGITTAYPTGIEDEISVSPGNSAPDDTTRKSFIVGFNANLRLWQAASDLLLELRLLESRKDPGLITRPLPTAEERGRIDHLFLLFVTSLDNLPPYLQPDMFAMNVDEDSNQLGNPLKQYIIQTANLYVSLHCLRLVIAQKLEEFNHATPLHNDILLLRKTEIARDMLRVIREAPFWSLQVNGEPCVSWLDL
ncbi:transcriptional regulator family: Fungal Specific TF [Penicillium lagena]|uniref:transcriptional regulator family: Fungal Specific TF n=1 Tax=Penicillium lagena TaxID=94218 RepID=UPI0025421804|nr:transcriptional regulator family: Fungal Specific TF [Penicillium lagena]KAJ5610640.1 transcriptional regulator family: Fungal Specific TF [Penicillium lagena]